MVYPTSTRRVNRSGLVADRKRPAYRGRSSRKNRRRVAHDQDTGTSDVSERTVGGSFTARNHGRSRLVNIGQGGMSGGPWPTFSVLDRLMARLTYNAMFGVRVFEGQAGSPPPQFTRVLSSRMPFAIVVRASRPQGAQEGMSLEAVFSRLRVLAVVRFSRYRPSPLAADRDHPVGWSSSGTRRPGQGPSLRPCWAPRDRGAPPPARSRG